MNDKQQLAAMGAHLADQQPLCIAKRIEELEAQVRVMAELLRDLREGAEIHLHNCTVCKNADGIANWTSKLKRIDAALAGKQPTPVVPEGWQLVPVEVTLPMQHAYFGVIDKNMQRVETDFRFGRYDSAKEAYRAMLAAAPNPDPKP